MWPAARRQLDLGPFLGKGRRKEAAGGILVFRTGPSLGHLLSWGTLTALQSLAASSGVGFSLSLTSL